MPLQGHEQALPVLNPVTDYEKIKRVGEGTYGVVCEALERTRPKPKMFCMPNFDDFSAVDKARHRQTGEIVALKKLRMDRERDGARKLPTVRVILYISNEHMLMHLLELHRHASHLSPGAQSVAAMSTPKPCPAQEGCDRQQT